jgi:hypothetical protein
MIEDGLRLRCPDCGRALRRAHLLHHGTLVLRRTCPGCRERWQVVVSPMGQPRPGMHLHELTWARRT